MAAIRKDRILLRETMSNENANETPGSESGQAEGQRDVTKPLGMPEQSGDEEGQDGGGEGQGQDETGEASAAAGKGGEQAGGEGEDGEQGGQKRPTGSQRLKRQNQALRSRLAELEGQIGKSGQAEDAGGDPKDPKPKEDDFPNDYLGFERALTAWTIRDTFRQKEAKDAASARQTAANNARQERIDAYEESLEGISDKIPDFDKVVGGMTGAKVSNDLFEEIISSEKGPFLTYHLAKNPAELERLNSLTGRELVREVARLEAKVGLPPAKTNTNAQKPATPPKGGAALSLDPDKMTQAQYEAWRAKGGGTRAGVQQ